MDLNESDTELYFEELTNCGSYVSESDTNSDDADTCT